MNELEPGEAELIENSSLGTPGARQLRERADPLLVRRTTELVTQRPEGVMSRDELRELSGQLRSRKRAADDDLVDLIAAEVNKCRDVWLRYRSQSPPAPIDELLPLIGWLIYEASWECLTHIRASTYRPDDWDGRAAEQAAFSRIQRLVDSARSLPWPERAPRALGALRALAIAEAKRDTEEGYEAAWILHTEARARYTEMRMYLGGAYASSARFVLGLDEVFLQLAIAETGTACRRAERVIERWNSRSGNSSTEGDVGGEQRWLERIFRDLSQGIAVGEQALELGERIDQADGFVDEVDEYRLTRHSTMLNPALMTARAASLLLAMRPVMQEMGRSAPDSDSWNSWDARMLQLLVQLYRIIEDALYGPDSPPFKPNVAARQQLVLLRLHLALLAPGFDLPSMGAADVACLAANPLDHQAVAAMSAWLASTEGGRHSSVLGAGEMPLFARWLVARRAEAQHSGPPLPTNPVWLAIESGGGRLVVDQLLAAAV